MHPVIFDAIDGDSVRHAALNTRGGAELSGMDAYGWRHILASRNYGSASQDLRNLYAKFVKSLCNEKVDILFQNGTPTSSLEAFLACRLLLFDKNPGLRPKVLRRIAGKMVMSVTKSDVQDVVGSVLVCAGYPCGCDVAIHGMRTIFEDEKSDAILLIDAANAFISINRQSMFTNKSELCPVMFIFHIIAMLPMLGCLFWVEKNSNQKRVPLRVTPYIWLSM